LGFLDLSLSPAGKVDVVIAKPTPRPKVRKPLKARPHGIHPHLRESVFARDNYLCQWCKVPGGHLDPHHILPLGRGGRDTLDNLVSLHRSCHRYVHEHPLEAKPMGLLA
jgi:5-methylcytosine-specific restriction endonuclease McrA